MPGAGRDERKDAGDEEVRRHGEDPARLPDAPQVGERQQRQRAEADLDAIGLQPGKRRCDGQYSRGDADGYGQRVVDEE